MNPKIPTDYAEVGRWLRNFATSHAKREDRRIEAQVEMEGEREGRAYGLRLMLGSGPGASVARPLTELAYAEVTEGRTRFAWCDTQARQIRDAARGLARQGHGRESRST